MNSKQKGIEQKYASFKIPRNEIPNYTGKPETFSRNFKKTSLLHSSKVYTDSGTIFPFKKEG